MSQSVLASAGRERLCAPCGTIYKAHRSTSLYCSSACRKRASRGSESYAFDLGALRNALRLLGFAGPIRQGSAQWGLTVPRSYALAEINTRWPPAMTEEEFAACLKALDIIGYEESGTACTARKQALTYARSKRR
jgi:hypothetical protein